MKRRITAIAAALLMIMVLFAGCGAKSYDSAATADEAAYDYGYYAKDDYDAPEDDMAYAEDMKSDSGAYDTSSLSIETEPGRLVILNADVNIETEKFAEAVAALHENVEKFGGYISASNNSIYNSAYSLHSGYFTIRIPAENFNSFVAEQDCIGVINYCNVWSDDVTDSYRDVEARLTTLRTKYDRLLAMLEEADIMADIIEIENALSETTYEIENYEGRLKSYDDRIRYSTITMEIREVREVIEPVEMPKTLGERVSIRFKEAMRNTEEFFEDFIVGLVGALPGIVIIAVLAAIVIIIIVKTRPGRLLRREKRREKNDALVKQLREKRDAALKSAEEKKNENEEK